MEELRLPVIDTNQPDPTWNSSIFSMDINPSAADSFFSPSHWDTSIDQNDPFESALSSIVSSPTPSYSGDGDGFLMRELIGRLGSICNNRIINSTNASCYTTPLNSPPKTNLPADVKSGNAGLGVSREGSSVSEHNPGVKPQQQRSETTNSRKRKSYVRGKGKEIPGSAPARKDKVDEWNTAKRSKAQEENDQKGNAKPPEDYYIHVRARRGQATDSHSLAERVRREKISERMKFLQDLVPGCSRVSGKAVVLDEIINYVQSLQRQVEFLSMKLATTVHTPWMMDFNVDALLSKDVFQLDGTVSQPVPAFDDLPQAVQYAFQAQQMQQSRNCLPNGSDTSFPIHTLNNSALTDLFSGPMSSQVP